MQKLDEGLGSSKVLLPGEGRSIPAGPFDFKVKVEGAETGGAFALAE